jgi:hypothetical protein
MFCHCWGKIILFRATKERKAVTGSVSDPPSLTSFPPSQADLKERLNAISGATHGEGDGSRPLCVLQLADDVMEHMEAVRGASNGRLQAEVRVRESGGG